MLSPAGDAGKDQPGVDRRAVVGPDAQPLAGAGAETVDQDVGLADQVEQRGGVGLEVEVDDAFAAVQQIRVLGGHLQPARATDPHDVGAQIGQDHAGVGSRPDAAELDDPDVRQRTPVHPLATLRTCLRSPSVAVSTPPFIVRFRMNPGIGTDRSIAMSKRTRVLSPSGVNVYPASWALS